MSNSNTTNGKRVAPTPLRKLWRGFKTLMVGLGMLTTMTLLSIFSMSAFSALFQSPEWEYALYDLVKPEHIEIIATESQRDDHASVYEAIIHIPSDPNRRKFLDRISSYNPAPIVGGGDPLHLRFIEEYGGEETPVGFDLYSACPYSNKSNPVLVHPGCNNTFYLKHIEYMGK